jgi:hypothetical protein
MFSSERKKRVRREGHKGRREKKRKEKRGGRKRKKHIE